VTELWIYVYVALSMVVLATGYGAMRLDERETRQGHGKR
jgi:hypothetical protein